jgi:hypothetical protein
MQRTDYTKSGCLLQPIQRLVEEANAIRMRRINKSNRLAVVDCDRTTSKIRGLSPKIISGDSR